MTADLVAFLRARLNEDEAAAHLMSLDANHPERWEAQRTQQYNCGTFVIRDGRSREVASGLLEAPARHVARFDPARVLAEVEAKRQLLDEFRPYKVGESGWSEFWTAVRLAALPYVGHPDYREEWRP